MISLRSLRKRPTSFAVSSSSLLRSHGFLPHPRFNTHAFWVGFFLSLSDDDFSALVVVVVVVIVVDVECSSPHIIYVEVVVRRYLLAEVTQLLTAQTHIYPYPNWSRL